MSAQRESPICREVQAHLPGLLTGSLPRWRRRLVGVHLRRCGRCRAELTRQRAVSAGLRDLSDASAGEAEAPPPELLDTLLEQADRSGVRGRVAVPARGAVSGARPAFTAVLLLLGAAVGTAVGYATWRSVGILRRRIG